MRLIVTGGGTGGHIYPAIAIADKFKEMDPNTEILYVGNIEGIEKDVVPKSGYPLKLVDARWLDHVTPKQVIWTGARVTHGIGQSLKVLKQFKPDAIIGTGGYVCFPVLLAARMIKCRKYLHEQNAYPGLANRTLEKYVDNIFLGFEDAGKFFKQPEKHVVAGNPVRKSFFTLSKKEAREKAQTYFKDFGLEGTEYQYPSQLSGGMRQRAALLRTYLSSNGVALLDEPFSALDTITKTAIHKWYLEVMQHIDLSTIFITHDIDEAILLSDRIYILNGKPGEIRDEIVIKEKKPRAEDFYLTDQFLAYKRKIIAKL